MFHKCWWWLVTGWLKNIIISTSIELHSTPTCAFARVCCISIFFFLFTLLFMFTIVVWLSNPIITLPCAWLMTRKYMRNFNEFLDMRLNKIYYMKCIPSFTHWICAHDCALCMLLSYDIYGTSSDMRYMVRYFWVHRYENNLNKKKSGKEKWKANYPTNQGYTGKMYCVHIWVALHYDIYWFHKL